MGGDGVGVPLRLPWATFGSVAMAPSRASGLARDSGSLLAGKGFGAGKAALLTTFSSQGDSGWILALSRCCGLPIFRLAADDIDHELGPLIWIPGPFRALFCHAASMIAKPSCFQGIFSLP